MPSTAIAMQTAWDYRLVALSVFIAIVGAYISLDFAGRMRTTQGQLKVVWFLSGATLMGLTIWSMHFIGMKALIMDMPIGYDGVLTLVSMLTAVFGAGIAFSVLGRATLTRGPMLLGSLGMGMAIVSMHYIGMASMQMPARTVYDPTLFMLSILIAIAVSGGALALAFRLHGQTLRFFIGQKVGSAVLMGIAISGMHYTGMAAARYYPIPQALAAEMPSATVGNIRLDDLLFEVGLAMTLILIFISARYAAEWQKTLQKLKESLDGNRQLLENARDFAIYRLDPRGNILTWNKGAERVFGYTEEEAIGLNFNTFFPIERKERTQQLLSQAAQQGEARDEGQRIRKDGGSFLADVVITPLYNEARELIGFSNISRDVTARRQAEGRNIAILESSLDGIIIMDHHGQVIEWNPGAESIFGYSREEVLGQLMSHLIVPPRYREAHNTGLKHYLATGEGPILGKRIELSALHKTGVEFPIELAVLPYLQEDTPKFVGTVRNLSERKRFEQALNESEQRFHNLADTAPMFIGMTDELGQAIYFNKTWLTFTGKTLEEMRGDGWLSVLHPEDEPRIREDFAVAFQNHLPIRGEFRFRRSDGAYRWMIASGAPQVTLGGDFIGYFGTYTDIDEIKQAQYALQESEARFRTMADSAPVLIWLADTRGGRIYANKPWLEFTGRTAEQELDQGWLDNLHPEDRDGCVVIYAEALKQRQEFKTEYRLKNRQGEYRWILDHGVPRYASYGEFIGFIGSAIDITSRKKAEETLKTAYNREHILRQVVEIVNHALEAQTILNESAKIIGEAFQIDRSFVVRYEQANGLFNIQTFGHYTRSHCVVMDASQDLPPEIIESLTHRLSAKQALQEVQVSSPQEYAADLLSRIHELPDLSDEQKQHYSEELHRVFTNKYNIAATLKVPIQYRGIPYGVITLQQCSKRRWQPEEVELLRDIATQVGIGIYQLDLYEQEQETAKREGILRKIVQAVHSPVPLEDKFQIISNELGRYLDADHVFISRYDQENQKLSPPTREYRYSPDVPSLTDITAEHLAGSSWLLRHLCQMKKPVAFDRNTPNISATTLHYLEVQQIQSGLGCAISYNQTCLAILFIHQTRHPKTWTPDEKGVVDTISRQAAIATHQAQLLDDEQKARQEAEEANRKKSDFLAMMSHELRTPLNSIIGYSRMIENGMAGPVTETQLRYIGNVTLSGNHLLSLVNDLLDVSKVEAGKMVISPERFELAGLIEEVQGMMAELAERKHVTLHVEISPKLDEIEADPSRFKQILINLLSNGIKFNREGGDVWLRLYPQNNQLVGEVEDTGIGIAEAQLSELFRKFYQLDASASRSHEGTGLGLALSKELIELHGGAIMAESTLGQGSKFTFTMPLHLPLHPLEAVRQQDA